MLTCQVRCAYDEIAVATALTRVRVESIAAFFCMLSQVGMPTLARIAITAITISSSIRVKPARAGRRSRVEHKAGSSEEGDDAELMADDELERTEPAHQVGADDAGGPG